MSRDRSRSPHGAGGEDDITSLVFQREQARAAKDFSTADSVRERLQQLGVQLFDKTNSWRCSDGRTGRIPTFSEVEGGQLEAAAPIVPTDEDPMVAQIKEMVLAREQARSAKDFAKSDQIRDELKAQGVDLQDKEKMWKSKDGKSGIIIGYRSTGGGGPTDMEVNTLVFQREKARQAGDYAVADMIRDELKPYGVDINDKDKVWRAADGRSGMVPLFDNIVGGGHAGLPPPPMHYAPMPPPQRGAYGAAYGHQGGGNDMQSQIVQAALAAANNPANARKTLQMLQSVGGGGAPPPPAPRGRPYGQAGPSYGQGYAQGAIQPQRKPVANRPPPPPQTSANPEAQEALQFISQCSAQGRLAADSEIEWLVTVREKMRQNKDYAASDDIRNAMRDGLGVQLHEKEKRWESNDGRQGIIPLWGAFA